MLPFDGDKLQRLMHEDGMDVVLLTSRHNVAYATGGYYMPFFARGRRFGSGQYLSAVGIPAADLRSAFYVGRDSERDFTDAFGALWITDLQWAGRRSNMTVGVAEKAAQILRGQGRATATIGVEFPFLPADAFQALRRDLPEATFVDATEVLGELRAIKRPDELARLRAVHRVTGEAIRAALGRGRPDQTTRQLAAEVRREIEAGGASFLYALPNVGPGLRRAPSSERLGRGRPLQVDAGAEFEDYRSDVVRMGSIGAAPARALEMFESCAAAQDRVRRSIGTGVACRDLWRLGSEALASTPWGQFGRFLAHGLGMVSHEPPEVEPDSARLLEAGMVVSIETEYGDADVGHVKLEDTVVVTETGCEGLGDVEREWCTAADG